MDQAIKNFFINEYQNTVTKLRNKAANPRARKAAEWTAKADELETIINDLKGVDGTDVSKYRNNEEFMKTSLFTSVLLLAGMSNSSGNRTLFHDVYNVLPRPATVGEMSRDLISAKLAELNNL